MPARSEQLRPSMESRRSLSSLDPNPRTPHGTKSHKMSAIEDLTHRLNSAERRLYHTELDKQMSDRASEMKTEAFAQANSAREESISQLREQNTRLREEVTPQSEPAQRSVVCADGAAGDWSMGNDHRTGSGARTTGGVSQTASNSPTTIEISARRP